VQRRGRTVLLTTHDMTEVARLAERVALIDHGKLIYDGALTGLRDLAGAQWELRVTVDQPTVVKDVPGLSLVADTGAELTYAPEGGIQPTEAVKRVIERLPVTGIRMEEPELEDIVRVLFS
jgi:ABC-2 type transport system ATP-binding protein